MKYLSADVYSPGPDGNRTLVHSDKNVFQEAHQRFRASGERPILSLI
jgi:hypothetical protein